MTAELDRAVANVALQNQMTVEQLRARLQQQGIAYGTFRNNVRDQMLVERVREREVNQRIKISNEDIDKLLEKQRNGGRRRPRAQHRADPGDRARGRERFQVVAQRKARARSGPGALLARISMRVAKEVSEDGNKAHRAA